MEQPRELSMLEHANQVREREAVRVVGWAALLIGIFCWSAGWFFLVHLPSIFGDGNGEFGFGDGNGEFGDGNGEPAFAAFFGLAAVAGCALAIHSRRFEEDAIFHARLAVGLNGLFLILAVTCFVKWL